MDPKQAKQQEDFYTREILIAVALSVGSTVVGIPALIVLVKIAPGDTEWIKALLSFLVFFCFISAVGWTTRVQRLTAQATRYLHEQSKPDQTK